MKVIWLVFIFLLIGPACSNNEFSAGGKAIESKARERDSGDVTSSGIVDIDGNSVSEGDGDVTIDNGAIQGKCSDYGSDRITETFLNFESIPGVSQGKTVDSATNQYFEDNYNVRFQYVGGAEMKLAKIVDRNETKVTFKGWASVLCPGLPNHNRLCASGRDKSGRWALTSSNAMSSKSIDFEVIYSVPARNPSFDLYDFDGNETWKIEAFDAQGNVVATKNINAQAGYNTATTSNSGSFPIAIDTGKYNIAKLRLSGRKNITIFGFGFDNFKTGVCKED